jgi:chromosome segregation ATPase
MDAADDNWQVADCVTDAQQKVAAISRYKQQLAAKLAEGEQLAATRISEIGADLDAATAAIRSQIAELEQLLQRKITQSAQDSAAIESDLRSTREAVARESRRMDAESDRLREIPMQFDSTTPSAT